MQIEGKKNLEFVKRAFTSHVIYCSRKAFRADEKTKIEYWIPEIKFTTDMIAVVDQKLQMIKNEESEG